ncbi:hypothetical protein T484DRAFT_3432045 [Baffinella frigidus]|nr:hypothetical protein T484DRAFT_3432045 [Cryptophyta sp. CCMP2293]
MDLQHALCAGMGQGWEVASPLVLLKQDALQRTGRSVRLVARRAHDRPAGGEGQHGGEADSAAHPAVGGRDGRRDSGTVRSEPLADDPHGARAERGVQFDDAGERRGAPLNGRAHRRQRPPRRRRRPQGRSQAAGILPLGALQGAVLAPLFTHPIGRWGYIPLKR